LSDEPLAVAFHPSGFHIIVSYADKLVFMNVLSNSIKEFHQANPPLKNSREIRFSNGGHYFAAANGTSQVSVYNFYSGA
jgi:hypothetical protein